jgi:hypothetical protein
MTILLVLIWLICSTLIALLVGRCVSHMYGEEAGDVLGRAIKNKTQRKGRLTVVSNPNKNCDSISHVRLP